LVVIPPGEFLMGSTEAEREWAVEQGVSHDLAALETMQHRVRIASPLAVGRYPVTFEQYDHFAQSTKREQPNDQGWGRGRRPVINISWDDAKAYVAWLAAATDKSYRLPSEVEWEYVCRAGTVTRFSWGDELTPENANYGHKVGRTSEVGSYGANSFGLYDTHGNVWEWVEDCWDESYSGARDDGSSWTTGDCGDRVQRGGSWAFEPGFLRSAARFGASSSGRYFDGGFRVARTLAAQPAVSPVNDLHWSKAEYHDPDLTGRVTFNYSNNDGRYSIGRDELFFETKWSKASDRSIHLYNDPLSIVGVAEASQLQSYWDVTDPASYDMSSRVRTIQEGEHAILKNSHNRFAVLRILDIKDRTRSDTIDELTFEFWILTDTI
jgi:formylglycine-generating enzyme required for sulfatase activity